MNVALFDVQSVYMLTFLLNLFVLLLGIQFKQVDAGGDQIIVGVSPVDDVFCLIKDANNVRPSGDAPWVQLAGKLKYYSCGPYSCWGVNAAGNIVIRRVSIPLRIQDLASQNL